MGRLGLAVDIADLRLDEQQVQMLQGITRLIVSATEATMAQLDSINSALDDLSGQITQVADQIAGLSAGAVTQADLDAIEGRIRGMAGQVDALIEPDAGEGEPPPAEGGETPTP